MELTAIGCEVFQRNALRSHVHMASTNILELHLSHAGGGLRTSQMETSKLLIPFEGRASFRITILIHLPALLLFNTLSRGVRITEDALLQ